MATESPIRMLERRGKWPSHTDAITFGSSSANMSSEELQMLLRGQRFEGNGRENVVPNRSESAPPSIERSNVNLNPRLHNNNWSVTSFSDFSNGSLHLSQSIPTYEEESEDDASTPTTPNGREDGSNVFLSGQDTTSSSQHKSLVDFVQDDFPLRRAVLNQSLSSNHETVEEAVDYNDPHVSSDSPITLPPGAENSGIYANTDPPTATVSHLSTVDSTVGITAKPPHFGRKSNTIQVRLEDGGLTSGVNDSDVASVESKVKAMNISRLPASDAQKNQNNWQNSRQNNMWQHQLHQQMISQGVNHPYSGMNQFLHGMSNFSSAEFTPPPYDTAAAYMASPGPFYPNLQPSSYFSPQYGVGGYALNTTAIPQFMPGYPPHSAIPLPFDGAVGPSFGSPTSGVSTGGSFAHGGDMQHLDKFYGQFAFSMPTSLGDPCHMQYPQQPTRDAYGVSVQFDAFTCTSLNPRGDGIPSSHYIGNSMNMGMLMQYPQSPIANPVSPGSPVGGPGFVGGKNELSFRPGCGRNNGIYPGWQGQRGSENFNDTRMYSFLEELKSGKGRRFELSDIAGRIVELSADQHGSRFIQQKLESCSGEEKASVFKEVLPLASKLMTDVFGNYVIQKFFEYGSPEQRKDLANQLKGQILPLSLQMYGCRVIQKALEVIDLEQKTKLVLELDGHVLRCVRDQNGNHVIQKCIERIPTDKIGFIISAFGGQVATLSMHPYGCRVIQRVLEHCTNDSRSQFIVDEILESICALAQDQYGNYVTQHVLERGEPKERSQIISNLSGHIVQMSQHKFASNVVEKCLEYGDSAAREMLIGEIVGQNDGNDNLLIMMKDQYANFVVQKVLETCTDNQRELLLSRVSVHLNALKKYTYGKHIAARFEQLYGEEIQKSES